MKNISNFLANKIKEELKIEVVDKTYYGLKKIVQENFKDDAVRKNTILEYSCKLSDNSPDSLSCISLGLAFFVFTVSMTLMINDWIKNTVWAKVVLLACLLIVAIILIMGIIQHDKEHKDLIYYQFILRCLEEMDKK